MYTSQLHIHQIMKSVNKFDDITTFTDTYTHTYKYTYTYISSFIKYSTVKFIQSYLFILK